MYICGKHLLTKNMMEVMNPFDGSAVGRMMIGDAGDVRLAGETALRSARTSRALSQHERGAILDQAAAMVMERQEEFARLIVREAGKTIRQARREVARCANTLRLSAEEARRLGGEVVPFASYPGSEQRQGYFRREPLGVILAITPYNDPLNLVAHKLGPAIAGGNSVILKPSELTPFSALRLVETLVEAGLPQDIVSVVTGDRDTGRALVSLDMVRMISFTGGTATGEAIVRAGGLKKYAMDLGGNAAVIVMEDCDLEAAAESCVSGAYWAAGQNCIGTQRILVDKRIYDRFEEAFVARVEAMRVGDPMDEATDMGPMICEAAALRAQDMVDGALGMGARCLAGHRREGATYHPTVLADVPEQAAVWREEVFAPIVSLRPINSLDEAIDLANSSEISLHAGIFTRNLEHALRAADRLEAGGVMVNDSSDYRLDSMPFGGFKLGSMGREGVRFAVEDMTQPKLICFNR